MKKIKLLIMSGGTLILLGIILKIFGVESPWPAICFGVGGTLKLLYMVLGVKTGQVKIGAEIALLIIGLAFIFMAVYFKKSADLAYLYVWFLTTGVMVKTLFVVLFIRRQKRLAK